MIIGSAVIFLPAEKACQSFRYSVRYLHFWIIGSRCRRPCYAPVVRNGINSGGHLWSYAMGKTEINIYTIRQFSVKDVIARSFQRPFQSFSPFAQHGLNGKHTTTLSEILIKLAVSCVIQPGIPCISSSSLCCLPYAFLCQALSGFFRSFRR